MTKEQEINSLIKQDGIDTNQISDGYHTFKELYAHRIALFIALCKLLDDRYHHHNVWMSEKHYDGSSYEGWFIMGISMYNGKQISYHLPTEYWDECKLVSNIIDRAPEWDGHTPADVLERLKQL